jgi:hypothetical protein
MKSSIMLKMSGVLDFVNHPVFSRARKHIVSETVSFSIMRWEGEMPTLLGPIEKANLSHSVGAPLHLKMETDRISEMLCFVIP